MKALTLKHWFNKAFPVLIVICTLTIVLRQFYTRFDLYGWISVVVGMLGVWMYYRGNPKYDKFYYLWVILQIPDIYVVFYGIKPGANAFPLSESWYRWLTAGPMKNDLEVGINWGVLLLLFLVIRMRRMKAVGERVILGKIKDSSFPGNDFPLFGRVVALTGFSEGHANYAIALEEPLIHEGQSYSFIIVVPAEMKRLHMYNHAQRCALRVCDNADYRLNPKALIADWILVERT